LKMRIARREFVKGASVAIGVVGTPSRRLWTDSRQSESYDLCRCKFRVGRQNGHDRQSDVAKEC
jgi:hypothetical protein